MPNNLNDYKKRTLSEQVLSEPDTFVGGSDELIVLLNQSNE